MLMPAARKLAEENNLKAIETSAIKGTVSATYHQEDVQAYMPANPLQLQKRRPNLQPVRQRRVRVLNAAWPCPGCAAYCERLVQSQSTAAILTTFNEVNMQAIIDLRARYKTEFEKEHGIKLGFMSFFVKAVIAALKNIRSSMHRGRQ